MTRDLRYDRAAFVLKRLDRIERLADRLKSAPMEVRRLGLLLAVAGWGRDLKTEPLTQFLADWLYNEWGLLPHRPTPQGSLALLRALDEDGTREPAARSAAEVEAEDLLQTAKVLTDRATPA